MRCSPLCAEKVVVDQGVNKEEPEVAALGAVKADSMGTGSDSDSGSDIGDTLEVRKGGERYGEQTRPECFGGRLKQ